jgi:AcrR family transcriptional regulator
MSEPLAPPPAAAPPRREVLLDAAESLFVARGVAATTVSDITERAGVAKGTFYLYFGSKADVVAGVHQRLLDGMTEIVASLSSRLEDGDYYDLADRLVAGIIDYWIERRATWRAVIDAGEASVASRIEEQADVGIVGMLEAAVLLGMDRGVVERADPRHTARFLYFGCQGVTHRALLADDAVDRDALVAASQGIVRRILQPR